LVLHPKTQAPTPTVMCNQIKCAGKVDSVYIYNIERQHKANSHLLEELQNE